MVVDLKELKDPQEVQKKLLKYTQCFELLEKLGADNCIDPDDFDEEDIEDELFKNLEITDIWELFNEDENPTASYLYNQTPVGPQKTEDAYINIPLDQDADVHGKCGDSDDEPLLLDQDSNPSDLVANDDEDLNYMDFDEQRKIYDKMQKEDTDNQKQ